MGAIGSHSTATTDVAWDAATARRNIPDSATASFYRRVFAYQDPEGDPDVMSTYSYPHHMVSSSGEVGAANTRACSSGIASLNGGRGGHSLSDGERRGVYAHLARHLRDADMEPPELQAMDDDVMEWKGYDFEVFVEKEEAAATDLGVFSGYASTWTKDLEGDRIAPGAFARSIISKKGVIPLLFNHDRDNWVGLSTKLAEDHRGLSMEGQLALKNSKGNDVYQLLRTAETLNYRVGLSIGFIPKNADNDGQGRIIRDVDLFEVSFTPFPANTHAHVNELKSLKLFERLLRDVGSYSQRESKRVIADLKAEVGSGSSATLDEAFFRRASEEARSRRKSNAPNGRTTVHRGDPV